MELTMRVRELDVQTRDADAVQLAMEMRKTHDEHVVAEMEMGNVHALQEEAWHELVVELRVLHL